MNIWVKRFAWPLFFVASFGLLIWWNKRDFMGTVTAGDPTVSYK